MAAKLRRTPNTVASVAAAVESRDFVTALDGALLVWRATRLAEVAELVDAIAARCQPVAIAGRSKTEFQNAWIVAAHNGPGAVAIGSLAATLTRSLPVRDVSYLTMDRDLKRNRPFLERVEALAKLPDDPRIAAALVELVAKAPFTDSRRLYEPVLALLEQLADERGLLVLERLIDRPSAKGSSIRAYFAEALPETVVAIRKGKRTPLAVGEAELVARLFEVLGARRGPAAPHRDVDELLAQVIAKPEDDAPRLVLADALLERDDPRGELISLQLQPQGEEERRRAGSLLRKHERQWLGELATVTKNRVWRRGFLDETELQNHAVADDATWERLAHDPALATVRVLHKGRANTDLYRSFVLSPQLRALRDIEVPTIAMLQELIDAGRRLDHVTIEPGLTKACIELLPALAERVGARRITVATREDPARLIDRLVTSRAHLPFDEIVLLPRWSREWETYAPRWLTAHDALAPVRRLGVCSYDTTRIIAERGTKAPRIEIEAVHDFNLEWALTRIGRHERLVIRGQPAASTTRGSLLEVLGSLKGVELEGGWAALYPATDRSRAPRARRS
jgi:uncharacterized protein (TIGR02996 family)